MEWQWGARKAFFSFFLPAGSKKGSLTRAYVVFAGRNGGPNTSPKMRAVGWVLDNTQSEDETIQREKSFKKWKPH